MMATIHLMKPELSNLIAAGEVIERPASVIKELVENAIDAQAKNIYIGIENAGKGKILVKDDGTGMDREDARMCFLRHASSKIRSEFDLSRIHTMGFRGEAIPSIASVSKVVLTTSTGEGAGTKVLSLPDKELEIQDAPSRKGTIFEVSDLFFNTPARLKYLKSDKVETYAIIEMAEHLALGFPSVSIALAVDGKEIFRTTGREDLLEAIQRIYGNKIVPSLYGIRKEGLYFSYEGYIGKPELSYSKKYNQLLFLNGRCIYDYRIQKAIEEAYRDYLPPLRYPFSLIHMTIDPALVDVNVHPTKKEVRISMENEMAQDLKETILLTLKNKRPLYESSQDSKTQNDLGLEDFDVEDLEEEEEKKIQESRADKPSFREEVLTFQDSLPETIDYKVVHPILPTPMEKEEVKKKEKNEAFSKPSAPLPSTPSTSMPQSEERKDTSSQDFQDAFSGLSYSGKLPEMHPIGQVLRTFIVCDGPDGFYLIDQHAAQERINFEKTEHLFASVRSRVVPLIPSLIELSFKEKENLDEEHLSRLLANNILVEPFGDKTVAVKEIPAFLSDPDYLPVIEDCVHSVLNDEKADPIALLRLEIADIACKKSIKANQVLTLPEMESLMEDLAKCVNPANCPHGRPTLIKITKKDIEKIFRRSGF